MDQTPRWLTHSKRAGGEGRDTLLIALLPQHLQIAVLIGQQYGLTLPHFSRAWPVAKKGGAAAG